MAAFDLQCAKNKAGKRCADVFEGIHIDECDLTPEFCTVRCAQELKKNDIKSDCCLYTAIILTLGTPMHMYVDKILK